jgi:hypothetical protein
VQAKEINQMLNSLSNGKVVQNISLKQAEGFRWASVKSDL